MMQIVAAAFAPRSTTPPASEPPSAPPSGTASTRTGRRPRRRWSPPGRSSLPTSARPAPTRRSTGCTRA
jgi:hypothetical protein